MGVYVGKLRKACRTVNHAAGVAMDTVDKGVTMNRRALLTAMGLGALFADTWMPSDDPAERERQFYEMLMTAFPDGQLLVDYDETSHITALPLPNCAKQFVIWVNDRKVHSVHPIVMKLRNMGIRVTAVLDMDIDNPDAQKSRGIQPVSYHQNDDDELAKIKERYPHILLRDNTWVYIKTPERMRAEATPEQRRMLPLRGGPQPHEFLQAYLKMFDSVERGSSPGRVAVVVSGKGEHFNKWAHMPMAQLVSPQCSSPQHAVVSIGKRPDPYGGVEWFDRYGMHSPTKRPPEPPAQAVVVNNVPNFDELELDEVED